MRNLVLVLGDQLDPNSSAIDDFDSENDAVWMAEVEEETTHVWCHQLRIAYFLSAMRHFRDDLQKKDLRVEYQEMQSAPSKDRGKSFAELLRKDVKRLNPEKLVIVEPGDDRVQHSLQETADELGLELETRVDRHFYCSKDEFRDYAGGRNSLTLEYFYREMRKRHDVLMESTTEPIEGQWNFDHDNRDSFKKSKGPGELPKPKEYQPDDITKAVLEMVSKRFKDHPGRLDHFTLPVTRRQALHFLKHFIAETLPQFGRWEDAMWTDEAFLYHSRLSTSLNIKLLSPRECVDAAVEAYHQGNAPINSVEGFVRQILGWREFVRGIYWLKMPDYAEKNFFNHQEELPNFYWDGNTNMECVRQSMQHVIEHGYSHHIHRLMVLGNFAQLWGVHPYAFHEWHMAMYLDAIDWVSLPNTLGMSQYGDGGVIGTKPYCSSGNYINKMSNFCSNCSYDYKQRTGENACPFTTLYWDFMNRHEDQLKDNRRLTFAMKNLEKIRSTDGELAAIESRVQELRTQFSSQVD